MKFKSMYSDHISPDTCPGDPIKIEYQLRVEDGEEKLVAVGKSDWYAYIQSHKDSVDIHKILERCALLEDYSALYRMPTKFMDTTDMPKSLAEAHAMVQDAKNYFDMMPLEIKEKYDNNYLAFIQDIGSKNFENNVSKFLDSIKDVDVNIKEEVKNES